MGMRRALGDFKELRDSVVELFDDGRSEEAEASLRITKSAQRFTKNTKEVVDDKLSFSATLMRAGEVQAANRLLAEVEQNVREEEAALIESVNEVKVAQSMRRARVTRLRLARMLAVATLGSALLSFSAAGMAVAGFLRDRAEATSRPNDDGVPLASTTSSGQWGSAANSMRRLKIGDVDVLLTKSQFERIRALTAGGSGSIDELEELLNVLPEPLAAQLKEAITIAEAETAEAQANVETVVAQVEKETTRKKRAAKKAAAEAQEESAEEQDPTPEPSPSEDDKNDSSGEEEDGDSGGTEEEGGDTGPPVPIKP